MAPCPFGMLLKCSSNANAKKMESHIQAIKCQTTHDHGKLSMEPLTISEDVPHKNLLHNRRGQQLCVLNVRQLLRAWALVQACIYWDLGQIDNPFMDERSSGLAWQSKFHQEDNFCYLHFVVVSLEACRRPIPLIKSCLLRHLENEDNLRWFWGYEQDLVLSIRRFWPALGSEEDVNKKSLFNE